MQSMASASSQAGPVNIDRMSHPDCQGLISKAVDGHSFSVARGYCVEGVDFKMLRHTWVTRLQT